MERVDFSLLPCYLEAEWKLQIIAPKGYLSYITSPGKHPNSRHETWLLLDICCFCNIEKNNKKL